MIINEFNNFYTNQISNKVADELIARIEALSALNRNVSDTGSSKQFYSLRDTTRAKPELLRRYQEWRERKIAYGEVRAFRKVSKCCNGRLIKENEEAPFLVTVQYDDAGEMVPSVKENNSSEWKSYGDIKYSVSDGLNKPSFYNGQPQAFLQSISVSNEGYAGVIQRVTIKMRVFTREAFEVIDKWFLRPGNEMLVKFGWSVPLTSMETCSEVIHAVIFNFTATMTDDIGWDITVYGIAKGNIAVGLAIGAVADEISSINNSQGLQTEYQSQTLVPHLTSIIRDELNRLQKAFPGIRESDQRPEIDVQYDVHDSTSRHGIVYESDMFPHGIGRIKFQTEAAPQDQRMNVGQSSGTGNNLDAIRMASNQELDSWLVGFRAKNPRFVDLETKHGAKSAQAFIEFYKGNFGLIEAPTYFGIGGNSVFPERSNPSQTEEFIKKDIFNKNIDDAAGAGDPLFAEEIRQQNNKFAAERPPVGPLRRKILNIMYEKLPDNRTDDQKRLEEAEAELDKRLQAIVDQRVNDFQAVEYRITEPQSSAKYFICLGDLVYFFNEKVFKQAKELYDSVQLLVENQPTTYDGNIVSALPMDVIFSNAKNTEGGMSAYGNANSINYGFKYKRSSKTGEFSIADGCDGVDFYPDTFFNSKEDMNKHSEDWGVFLNEHRGEKVAAFNIAHIWISVDVISEAYIKILKDKAIDPHFKTVFDFFNEIFGRIAQASANIIQLTLVPDSNQLYSNLGTKVKKLNGENPLLSKTQLFRIVDVNFQPPHHLPNAPVSFDFKVNDVNQTILRDVNISLKLPSKLQTVAYTYGRAGMNEDIVDVQDDSGICEVDYKELITKRNDILLKLYSAKYAVSQNMSRENIEQLLSALGAYASNPVPTTSSERDTINTSISHQAWLYNKLYPIELKFKIDGIAGFLYGNMVNVINALPSRYNNAVYFTLTKIEHEIQNNDWVTTLTAIARLKNSHGLVQFPKLLSQEGRPDLCDKYRTQEQPQTTVEPELSPRDSRFNNILTPDTQL